MSWKLPLSRLSFRWQITLLGAQVAVLFVAVLIAALVASRYTKSAVLNSEKKALLESADVLAREYTDRVETARRNHEATLLENLASPPSREILTLLSRVVLQNSEGIAGGFYSATGDQLVGYSFPTGQGVGVTAEVPIDERMPIIQVAREATLQNRPAETVLTGVPDIVLIEAVPIRLGQDYAGSAFAIKRLPSFPGSNRFRAYLMAIALGASALASVLLTLLVVQNLQNGVRKIEGGLKSLEEDLASQIPTGSDPNEIRRIAGAINRLGSALKQNIEHERQIEDQLRHSERLVALGRLVAGVAHEVRNPLSTIRLRVQMCQRNSENPRVGESCAVALEEIERLNSIVSRLLTFAQPVHLNREPVNLSRLAEERLRGFRDKARKNGVKFITNFDDDGNVLHIDQVRMAQVFDNIIQNAMDAISGAGGTIWVTVSSAAESAGSLRAASIEFRDSGRGIHPAALHHIFDPFFTTKTTGTGLGLSICHELVLAHGGTIRVESAEGRGTNVNILLPFRNGDVVIPTEGSRRLE